VTATTYETDPRPFADVLRDWMRVHGYEGEEGIREAAPVLGVNPSTLRGWYFGRSCPVEGAIRKLMAAMDRLPP
jgi:hypothetical protein